MAKMRTYIISFNKAERTERGYYRVSFEIGKPSVNHRFISDNFVKLEAEVRRLAAEYGLPCSPYVRVPSEDRKPPGFDAFMKTINIIEA